MCTCNIINHYNTSFGLQAQVYKQRCTDFYMFDFPTRKCLFSHFMRTKKQSLGYVHVVSSGNQIKNAINYTAWDECQVGTVMG